MVVALVCISVSPNLSSHHIAYCCNYPFSMYFTYVNHTPLQSHPVYSTLNRLTRVYTLIAVVLSYVFFLILYIVSVVAVCQLSNKQMID